MAFGRGEHRVDPAGVEDHVVDGERHKHPGRRRDPRVPRTGDPVNGGLDHPHPGVAPGKHQRLVVVVHHDDLVGVVTTLLGSNIQTSHEDLAAHVTNGSVSLLDPSTADRFGIAGDTAMAMVNAEINRQAAMVAYIDDFWLMMWVTLASVPLVLLLRPPKPGGPKASAADMGH